jgi:hypothetical protein
VWRNGQLHNLPSKRFDFSLSGIEAAYRIPNNRGETVLSARAGMTKIHEVQSGTNLIFSPYHWGIAVGYDYLYTSWFVFGFEGSYLHFEPSWTMPSATKYQENSFNIMGFMLTLQFRL